MTTQQPPAEEEMLTVPSTWHINYNYAAGRTASRFFVALRDEGRIEATVCPTCERALMPPRSFCDRCFRECEEWRDVGPEGSVVSFTVSSIRSAGMDKDPPFMIAMIRLDGASTNIIHLVEGCDLSDPEGILRQVSAGLRVRANFKPEGERTGQIMDIRSFERI